MLQIKTLTVGQMQTNCYLVFDTGTKDCLIIDPGDDADYITRIILDLKLKPQKIIATHGHFDHILGATELKLSFKIPFYIHKNDVFLVKSMQKNAKYFLGIEVDPPPVVDGYINNKDNAEVGEKKLTILETPGHTPGSICLYAKEANFLLSGDTLFAKGGLGRTDFSYSSRKLLTESLKTIFRLPLKTAIYPGHGNKSELVIERTYHRVDNL